MSKIELLETNSGYNLQKINSNFQKIEEEFNEKVLYRDNPTGEPNEMNNDLDMNGNRVYNLPVPLADNEAARLKDVQDAVTGITQANLINFQPTSTISAGNVQAAIEEVDAKTDAGLRGDLASGSGADNIGFNGSTVGAALTDLSLDSIYYYGGVGDGSSDAGVALSLALQTQSKIQFPWTEDGYKFETTNITLSDNIEIDFNGNKIDFGDTARLRFQSPIVVSGLTITENVLTGSAFVKLNSIVGIQAGDLFYINTNQSPSTEWLDTKKDCVRILGFQGDYIRLEEPLNFSYTTSDPGLSVIIYRPKSVKIKNAHLLLGSDANPRVMVEITGCQDVELENITIEGQSPIDTSSSINRVGIMLYRCFGVKGTNINAIRMSYPVEADGGTRNSRFYNISATECHHTIEAADWASNLVVDGLNASACYSAISAHPSFNVHFRNFSCLEETGLANLRTLGGSLANGVISTRADDNDEYPQFQSIILDTPYQYLEGLSDFSVENVTWVAPSRAVKPVLEVRYGRNVTISGTVAPLVGMSFGSRNQISNLIFGPGNRFGSEKLPSPSKALVRNSARISAPPLLPAYESSGRYVIDASRSVVDTVDGYVKMSGPVRMRGSGTDSFAIPIRVYVDVFPEVDSAAKIVGIISLKSAITHTASGRFASIIRTFNFEAETSSPASSIFPTTPVFSSTPSGQTNENLSMTITSVNFSSDSTGFFADFTVNLDASGLGPVSFNLGYELEMFRCA